MLLLPLKYLNLSTLFIKSSSLGLGVVAHTCISALWEAELGRLLEPRSLRPAWVTMVKPRLYKKYKINWACWHVPIVPATQEAEAGESLEPRR